jgi:hypothetical protein
MRGERNVYMVLVGKPGGKRHFGRLRQRWEDAIRMNLIEVGWVACGVDLVGSG